MFDRFSAFSRAFSLFLAYSFCCGSASAYTAILQVSGAGVGINVSDEIAYEESLIRKLSAQFGRSNLKPDTRVEIRLDERGAILSCHLFNQSDKTEEDLTSKVPADLLGQLPVLYEPSLLELSFQASEIDSGKLVRTGIVTSGDTLRPFSIKPDGVIVMDGSSVHVDSTSHQVPMKAYRAITEDDERFRQSLFLIYTRPMFNSISRASSNDAKNVETGESSRAICQAKKFLAAGQKELAINFLILSGRPVSYSSHLDFSKEMIARIVNLISGTGDSSRLLFGLRFVDVLNGPQTRPARDARKADDEANFREVSKIFEFKTSDPSLDLARLHALKRLKEKFQKEPSTDLDRRIVSATRAAERQNVSSAILDSYHVWLDDLLKENDLEKINMCASEFLTLTKRLDVIRRDERLPFLHAQTICALNQGQASEVKTLLGEQERTYLVTSPFYKKAPSLYLSDRFKSSKTLSLKDIARTKLSTTEFSEMEELFEKADCLEQAFRAGFDAHSLRAITDYLFEVGRASFACELLEDAKTYLLCTNKFSDLIAMQRHEISLLEKNSAWSESNALLAKTRASLDESLEHSADAMLSVNDFDGAITFQFELIESYRDKGKIVDANNVLRKIIESMRNSKRPYYRQIWSLISHEERLSPTIDLGLLQQLAVQAVKNDHSETFDSPGGWVSPDAQPWLLERILSAMAAQSELSYGRNSAQLKLILNRLVEVRTTCKNYDGAIEALESYRAIPERLSGRRTNDAWFSSIRMANLKLLIGSNAESEALFRSCLTDDARSSLFTVNALSHYVVACAKLGQLPLAERCCRNLLNFEKAKPTHAMLRTDTKQFPNRGMRALLISLYDSVAVVANHYRDSGRHQEASSLLAYAIECNSNLVGPKDTVVDRWEIALANECIVQASAQDVNPLVKLALLQQSSRAFSSAVSGLTHSQIRSIWLYNWAVNKRIGALSKLGMTDEVKNLNELLSAKDSPDVRPETQNLIPDNE